MRHGGDIVFDIIQFISFASFCFQPRIKSNWKSKINGKMESKLCVDKRDHKYKWMWVTNAKLTVQRGREMKVIKFPLAQSLKCQRMERNTVISERNKNVADFFVSKNLNYFFFSPFSINVNIILLCIRSAEFK